MEITFVVDMQQLLDSTSPAPSYGDTLGYVAVFPTAD
ncbi:UNVERIFIED_ORG: hypothetical protein J2Y77_001937 [Pseudomonas lini]